MSVRSFKKLFSIVFAAILGSFGLTLGLYIKYYIDNATALPWLSKQWYYPVVSTVASLSDTYPFYLRFTVVALAILGVLIGVIVGPKLAQAIVNAGNAIERMSTKDKLALGCGTIMGTAAMIPFLLVLLRAPTVIGIPLAILLGVAFVYLGIRATVSMKDEFRFVGPAVVPGKPEISMERCKILDTNVIIDGRIADICRTGFIEGPIYVPGFVLDELQHIADSSDSLKRARGRRGLDILNAMQKEFPLIVRSYDHKIANDRYSTDEVDTRLVSLAKALGGSIVTNDFNLNKVAALQGVVVLNVNELANALKPVVLPGEEMTVTIIKEGKDQNQGVAYLDDGTMIVVEDGRRYIGESIAVVVTSVLQTVAGKMIFARVKDATGEGDTGIEGGRGRYSGGSRQKVR